jgi:hypothetical protein
MVVVRIVCGFGFDMVVMVCVCIGVKGERKRWGFGRAL